MVCEEKQRVLAKKIGEVTILQQEREPLSFLSTREVSDKGGEEIKEVPFVYRPKLIATISDDVEKRR